MRSECIAAWPKSTCSYAWKLPVTPYMRSVLFEQAHDELSRMGSKPRRETFKAEHPSIPWKAYLASREFQNLASDLAEAVFAPASDSLSAPAFERPASLFLSACAFTRGGKTITQLLVRAVPEEEDLASGNDGAQAAAGLALAA